MREEDEFDGHSSTHRLEAFSDGVFAIAITLLIIEIGVPDVGENESLAHALGRLWPSYAAYVLSFITIGIYWVNHHAFFQFFARTDHYFLLLNVFFLMTIAFLPFPTAVLGDYMRDDAHRAAAVSFYIGGLLLPALGWQAMWIYGYYRGLVVRGLAPAFTRFLTYQYLASGVIYGAALLVSLIDAWVGLGFAAAITAIYLLPPRRPVFTTAHGHFEIDHDHLEEP